MQYYSQGGMQIPPSPIGNVGMMAAQQQPLPMSSVGNYYNPYQQYGFYNPWEAQRRQDEMIKQQNLQIDQQIAFQKALVINANKSAGIEVDQKELDEAFQPMRPTVTSTADAYKQYQDNTKAMQINQAINSPITYSTIAENCAKAFVNREENLMKRREGKTLEEQLSGLNELCFEMDQEDAKLARRNLSNTYDHTGYKALVSQTTDPLRSMFANADVDDMEITLPSGLGSSYAQRRMAFMNTLLGH